MERVTPENIREKSEDWLRRIGKFNVHRSPVGVDHSALLVIDMQKFFLGSSVASLVDPVAAILPNVKRLIDRYREKGRPVIYTRHVHNPDGSDLGILGEWWDDHCKEGTEEAEIHDSIAPRPDDKVICKNRYSAFHGTDLADVLRSREVEEVVISGVMTNICCESTARDAFFRDIWVRFVADATASVTEEMHVATLLNLAYAFAEVCLTEDVLRA
ncbi:MAG: cysteine hydrolase [Thermoplasmata archaeon]|nr:cysteine hydrolase [Thermoplasmata archaeon]